MKFQKKYLYTKPTKAIIDAYYSKIEQLNKIRDEVELITKETLTDKQLLDLANEPNQFIHDLKAGVKERFTFSNASDQFNLDSLGISYKDLDAALSQIPDNGFEYDVADNLIQPKDSEIKRLEESQKVYTVNQRQNDLLDALNEICKAFMKLDELNGVQHIYMLRNMTGGLLQPQYEKSGKLVPMANVEMIATMN